MDMTQCERDELEQLLLYVLYPDNYEIVVEFDNNLLLDILHKLETEREIGSL